MAAMYPPYNPLLTPSSNQMVRYAEIIFLYFLTFGAPCCLVLTVSSECIAESPIIPPIPPEMTQCHMGLNPPSESVVFSCGKSSPWLLFGLSAFPSGAGGWS